MAAAHAICGSSGGPQRAPSAEDPDGWHWSNAGHPALDHLTLWLEASWGSVLRMDARARIRVAESTDASAVARIGSAAMSAQYIGLVDPEAVRAAVRRGR